MQVHTVNSNRQTSDCQCSLFSKKNPIIWIFFLSGCLTIPSNPESCCIMFDAGAGHVAILSYNDEFKNWHF